MYIFDIGANVGKFSEAALQKYPSAHLIMVEANEKLANFLDQTFQNRNVTVVNRAVAKESDIEMEFYISNADTISTASKEWIANSRFTGRYSWHPIIVKSITIDKLLELFPSPEIIKIDVEGHEYEVIQGLTKKQNKICFEWAEEQKNNVCNVINYLAILGYEKFGFINGDDHLVEPDVWTTKDECIESMDMIPERKEKWGMVWAI